MSKRKGRDFIPLPTKKGDCVCHTVRNIIKAQEKVKEDDCVSGCNWAVRQLKGETQDFGPRKDTIPFMLYCKDTCKPFVGNGIFKAPKHAKGSSFFGSVESVVFRAKNFVKGSDCCVNLELLAPVAKGCGIVAPALEYSHSACSFFPADDPVTDFLATGICLTVDLNNFMGIYCLDPITPLTEKEFPLVAPPSYKYD